MIQKIKRLTWGSFVDKAFWAMSIGLVFVISGQVKDLNHGIHSLNEKMATIIERTLNQEKRGDQQDKRIDRLEDRVSSLELAPRGPSTSRYWRPMKE